MDFADYKPDINENSDHFQDKDMIGKEGIDNPLKEEIPMLCDSIEYISDELKSENEEIPVSKDEVRVAIENAFRSDKNLIAKLIKLADNFKKLYDNGKLFDSKDIVMEAIEDILKGKRKWYKNKCERITIFIAGVIKSKIRNYANSNNYKINKKVVPLFPSNAESESEFSENSIYDEERAKYFNSDNKDEPPDTEEYFNKVLKLFDDDEIAYCVLDELLSSDKYDKKEQNQLLAKELGISVREVENAKKRIKYRLSTKILPKRN